MIRKEAFQKRFRGRYSLRFHMGVILIVTALSGALTSKLLLVCNVNNLAVRYPLAVVCSYLIFFVCIKLWLLYVSPTGTRTDGSGSVDWLVVPDSSGGPAHGTLSAPQGGGGEFSGGGASADFGADSGSGPGAGDVVSGVTSVFDDDSIGGIIFLAILAAIVAAVAGAAIYVVIQAPAILSEAAFEGLLAASLVKKTRLMDGENWMGSVFKATWAPFAVTLFLAAFGGLLLHDYFPEAHRLMDVLKRN